MHRFIVTKKNNVSAEQCSQYGQDLIKMAEENNHVGIRKCWLEWRSIELNQVDLNKAFIYVLKNYNKNKDITSELRGALHNLILMGADPNCEAEDMTALTSAIYKNDTKLFDLLCLHNVNIKHITKEGDGALNIAIYRKVDPHIIMTLLDKNADVGHVNKSDSGYTVLMWAIFERTSPDIIEKILTNENNNINAVNDDKETALDIFIKEKLSQSEYFSLRHKTCVYNLKILSLLLIHHANMNDFSKLYKFLSTVYKKSEEFFQKPSLFNQHETHVKDAFFNLLTCFDLFCTSLKKQTAEKEEAKVQPKFENDAEADMCLSKLKKVSDVLQQISGVSSSQLNVFKEKNDQKRQRIEGPVYVTNTGLTPRGSQSS